LVFTDDYVLLSFTESGPTYIKINDFAAASDIAGMKISTTKAEVLHLSSNPNQCSLQVSGTSLKQVEKFKYLGVVFRSNGRQDMNKKPERAKLVQCCKLCNIELS